MKGSTIERLVDVHVNTVDTTDVIRRLVGRPADLRQPAAEPVQFEPRGDRCASGGRVEKVVDDLIPVGIFAGDEEGHADLAEANLVAVREWPAFADRPAVHARAVAAAQV